MTLKAPFPWFGGKSRVAALVWERFGDVYNYVEPFAGSLAVPLGRPHEPRIETVNDIDCYLSNFWRALARAPLEVAHWADWPVNEADLHARHRWLVDQDIFRERMRRDPDFYDAQVAGWWVWGISMWIGDDWCKIRAARQESFDQIPTRQEGLHEKRPNIERGGGRGVHRIEPGRPAQQKPDLGPKRGLNAKRPNLWRGGPGVHRTNRDRGIHTRRPVLKSAEGIHRENALLAYFEALAARLRHVRVCCGDWKRLIGPTPTYLLGLTGVFLDPPYGDRRTRKVYNFHNRDVAAEVREYALANGDNPKLRIAMCGYEGEHEFPATWEVVAWKANGGYANHGTERKGNSARERIWFSPHCLKPAATGLFEGKS